MNIAGSGIHDPSARFRMYAVVLAGIAAFGALLLWRGQEFAAAEYVDFPSYHHKDKSNLHSVHYQIKALEENLK